GPVSNIDLARRQRTGGETGASYRTAQLRARPPVFQRIRRSYSAIVVAGWQGADARFQSRHFAWLGRHLARARRAGFDARGAPDPGRGDAVPHRAAVVA